MKKSKISKKDKEKDLTSEEFKDSFEFLGRKLGFFISALNAPEEVKNSWLSIVPKMSLEQIERLVNVFEEKYLQQETQYIDDEFKKVFEEIEKENDKKIEKIDNEAIKKINNLAKKISN